MAHMSFNVEIPRRDFREISKLTNWTLDKGATFHMKPDISDFIPGPMAEKDKYIEVSYGNFHRKKQEKFK